MTLSQIFAFIALGGAYSFFVPPRIRPWMLMVGSLVAIYWLQPITPIRWLDYLLPTAIIVLTMLIWFITKGARNGELVRKFTVSKPDTTAIILTFAIIILMTTPRYIQWPVQLTGRPPETGFVVVGLLVVFALSFALMRFRFAVSHVPTLALLGLIILFVADKWPPLTEQVSSFMRSITDQDRALASAMEIQWLGFSYVAFRLIHVVRDHQTGRLPDLHLHEFIAFVIFFPAYIAGPIDRAERFSKDFRNLQNLTGTNPDRIAKALTRTTIGLLKKFVIADSLALFSLSEANALQAENGFALWFMLYAYAFRLFFDFSGYTDIAIGIGLLFGIKLPENFDRPYLKRNITLFWQSWHITLSNWVRFYIYTPVSRWMLRSQYTFSKQAMIFTATITTMLIIGLWHGITMSFLIWGLWHGVGLFVHQLWSIQTRSAYNNIKRTNPALNHVWSICGVVLTFHFVVIGWVWFALPDVELAVQILTSLFGIKI